MATVTRRVPYDEVPEAWREGLDDAPTVKITLTTEFEPTTQPRKPGAVLREVHALFQAAGGCDDLPVPAREPIGDPMTFGE
ncbi:MAG: hypothetical protein GKR94_06160 [Gammaproteobacteria bacterium]|nr:hypothetical protein [Gammaproteobacteria bacterium]